MTFSQLYGCRWERELHSIGLLKQTTTVAVLWGSPARALRFWDLHGKKLFAWGKEVSLRLSARFGIEVRVRFLFGLPSPVIDTVSLTNSALATTVAQAGYSTRHMRAFARVLATKRTIPDSSFVAESARVLRMVPTGALLVPFARCSKSTASQDVKAQSSSLATQDAVIRRLLKYCSMVAKHSVVMHFISSVVHDVNAASSLDPLVLNALLDVSLLEDDSEAKDVLDLQASRRPLVVVVVGIDRIVRHFDHLGQVLTAWRRVGVIGALVLYRMEPNNYADRRKSVLLYDPRLITADDCSFYSRELEILHRPFLSLFVVERAWANFIATEEFALAMDNIVESKVQ